MHTEQNGELIDYFQGIHNTTLTPVSIQFEKDWTVDLGDDPAFLSSATYKNKGGKLSWSICRPDILLYFKIVL